MLTLWNMFDDFVPIFPQTRAISPSVHSDEDAVTLTCDVPGVKTQDVDITVQEDILAIRWTRKNGSTYNFERSYRIPETLDAENLSADLADGVLTVRIPKLPKAKARRIPITVSGKQLTD